MMKDKNYYLAALITVFTGTAFTYGVMVGALEYPPYELLKSIYFQGIAAALPQQHQRRNSTSWSSPAPLTGSGAMQSPGGTHELVTVGNNAYFIWWDLNDKNIYSRRSTNGGITWGNPTTLVSGIEGGMYSLEVSGSTHHLFWLDTRTGSAELYYKRSTDGGVTWGPDTQLSFGGYGTGLSFRYGTTISGSAVHVAWVPNQGSWGDVNYRRSTDYGSTWQPTVKLTTAGPTGHRPVIAANGNDVHVVWMDWRGGPLNSSTDWRWELYHRRSSDGGASWGPETQLTFTPNARSSHPQIVAPQPGLVVVIYEDGWTSSDGINWGGDGAIYARRSIDAGRNWEPPKRISFVNQGTEQASHSKANAFGSRIFVQWTEYSIPGLAAYYSESLDGGVTWGPNEFLAGSGKGRSSSVAGTDSYVIATVWDSSPMFYLGKQASAPPPAAGSIAH
jgi:hypothetical protein